MTYSKEKTLFYGLYAAFAVVNYVMGYFWWAALWACYAGYFAYKGGVLRK